MKKIILFTIFVVTIGTVTKAQGPKIEAIKVAFITKALNLSTDEAQKFWPVYNKYFAELKQARQTNTTDELKFEEEVLAIRKKYKPEFKKILVADDRVNKVFRVDLEFREVLQKELKRRAERRQKAVMPQQQ